MTLKLLVPFDTLLEHERRRQRGRLVIHPAPAPMMCATGSVMTESAFHFDPAEHARFEESLTGVDDTLRSIALKHHLRLTGQSSKGWPGRTLRRRRWLKTYFLRITLNTTYLETGRVLWDIEHLWMYDYGELVHKTITFHSLAKGLAANEIGSARIRELIASVVMENLGSAA